MTLAHPSTHSSNNFIIDNHRAAILSINVSALTIKFAAHQLDDEFDLLFRGELDRTNLYNAEMSFTDAQGHRTTIQSPRLNDEKSIINFLIHSIEQQECFGLIRAVGHRVVHDLDYSAPVYVTQPVIDELKSTSGAGSKNLSPTLELMEALLWRHPSIVQIACFDNEFHETLPSIAKLLTTSSRVTDSRFKDKGARRSGFHGVSYSYLMDELARRGDVTATRGRVVLAYLGSGSSMTAVLDGKSIDTSMEFSAAGGLPMGTRASDNDSGVNAHLARSAKLNPELFNEISNSSLPTTLEFGTCKIDSTENKLSTDAIALFCYQSKKLIGSYAAAMGGIDTLVFAGDIGENSAAIRALVCEGLRFLGIELDAEKNNHDAEIISKAEAMVKIYVIKTNEELMITRLAAGMLPQNRLPN